LYEAKGGKVIGVFTILVGVFPVMVGSVLSVLPGRLEALGTWIAGISPVSLPIYGAARCSRSQTPERARARSAAGLPSGFRSRRSRPRGSSSIFGRCAARWPGASSRHRRKIPNWSGNRCRQARGGRMAEGPSEMRSVPRSFASTMETRTTTTPAFARERQTISDQSRSLACLCKRRSHQSVIPMRIIVNSFIYGHYDLLWSVLPLRPTDDPPRDSIASTTTAA
jgi:hypothetical protein